MRPTVLVVDDDPTILRTLRINLRARGYDVEAVTNAQDAMSAFAEAPADLVVLDLGLPDLDGIEVLRRLRAVSRVPVIVLSARQDSDDKVEALDEGADDYVTKPFGMDELMARVRAAIRRVGEALPSTPPFVCRHFTLDFDARVCEVAGSQVHLTPTEWRLLAELSRHAERIVPHENLLKAAWGPSYGRESNYLRVFASQLRRKLEPDPSRPVHLLTEPGLGYRLVP
jgi:two-component system KDP operon response regulator KdpE